MQHDTLALPSMNTWIPEDLNSAIAAGGAAATAIVGFLTGRKSIKRADTDNDGAELDNVAKAISIWQDTATKLNANVQELRTENQTIQSKVTELKHLHELCEDAKIELAQKVECLSGEVCKLRDAIQRP